MPKTKSDQQPITNPSEEIVAVVDEAGNTLSKVPRSELTDQHRWKIISVWIENSHGEVLLQQRSLKKKLGPGMWTCAVEGTVEDDDSYLDTATREIEEEIGLTDFSLIPANKILYRADFGSRLAQGYRVNCDWPIEKFTPQPEEVEQLQWRDKLEVIQEIQNGDSRYPRAAKGWLDMFDLV